MQGIYRIRNKINGKRYVGESVDIEKRWEEHRKELGKDIHYNIILQQAWNKYGAENFVFEFVEEVRGGREDRLACEQDYLDKGFQKGILYNIARVAGGGATLGDGWHHTEETKAKISKALLGRGLSEEHCANLSRALMGHEVTEETCIKISKANSGENHYLYGRHHTGETKTKISVAGKGNDRNAKPYPTFFNVQTGEHILGGLNLAKMCREYGLNYCNMINIRNGTNKQTRDGWGLDGVTGVD